MHSRLLWSNLGKLRANGTNQGALNQRSEVRFIFSRMDACVSCSPRRSCFDILPYLPTLARCACDYIPCFVISILMLITGIRANSVTLVAKYAVQGPQHSLLSPFTGTRSKFTDGRPLE